MSTSGNKRSRSLCIRAYILSTDGYTHRQIAELMGLRVDQIPGKIKRGRLAMIRDERLSDDDEGCARSSPQ